MTGTLQIQTALREGRTILKNVYHTTPFKIANITESKGENQLNLMLMSSSPGILDGDVYTIRIDLDEGCALRLYTQSYQRIFTMKESATQKLEVYLSANSSFCFLPHPAVPHERSSFSAINKIYLSGNCRLVFGEILTCGRKLNGEVFLFSKYHNITEVYLRNKLVIKENLLLQPGNTNLNAIGQLEGYSHQASMVYLDENADIKNLIQIISAQLSKQKQFIFGITAAPVNGLIIRMLGQKAEQLFECLNSIALILPQAIANKPIVTAA